MRQSLISFFETKRIDIDINPKKNKKNPKTATEEQQK